MIFLNLIPKFLPIILLLLIGIIIKRVNFLSEASMAELKKFVVNISLPALLFFAFLNTNFQLTYIWIILVVFLLNIIMLFFGKFVQSIFKVRNIYFPLMFTGFEMGMLGFSLYGSIYGAENLNFIGVLDLGQEIFVWFVLVSILSSLQNNAISIKASLKTFISSPVIISILLGTLLNILGLRELINTNIFLSGFTTTLSMIAQITIPLILIIIGYQLKLKFSKFHLPFITILFRLLSMIILGILINIIIFNHLLHLQKEFSIAFFTMLILPPPFIIPLFIRAGDIELEEYVGNTLSLGTIFTIFGFYILVLLFAL